MKRGIKLALLLLVVLLIVLQFFQPERNQGSIVEEGDFITEASLPDSLAAILINSCYDCHSNHTEYPWYSRISPVWWYLHKHIVDGKEELNLSEFGDFSKAEKIGALTDLYDALEAGTMPLQSYILIHGDARLSQEEVDALLEWVDLKTLSLMKK
jgi:hypothetical protein